MNAVNRVSSDVMIHDELINRYDAIPYTDQKGLNISTYKQDEETVLMLASRQGSSDIVKLLVENGADLMATNKVSTEILYISAFFN